MFFAAWKDPQAIMGALLQAGCQLTWKDHQGRTALHLAVNASVGDADASSDMEEWLIEQGADVLAKDARGRLPLHYVFVKIQR